MSSTDVIAKDRNCLLFASIEVIEGMSVKGIIYVKDTLRNYELDNSKCL